MTRQPRHHHYVPQFYLAGFTATGTPDATLHVLDCEQIRQWSRIPKGTAHERDFHAVDLGSTQDRMIVEKKLAECEGKWASALREVHQEKVLPQDDLLGDLLAFVSFMTVRVPRIRNQVSDFIDRASKAELRATFETTEGRQHFRSVIDEHVKSLPASEQRRVRKLLDDDPNLDQMAEHVKGEGYTVRYDQTWNVQTMLQMAITLLPALGQREWAIWNLAADAPDLICSDSPVCLTWNRPMPSPYPPGFCLANTLVTAPLGKRLILASTIEPLPATQTLTLLDVARMNTRTAMFADQLYSPDTDFTWLMEDAQIGHANDFMEYLKSKRKTAQTEAKPYVGHDERNDNV